jgi:hypothetical protein
MAVFASRVLIACCAEARWTFFPSSLQILVVVLVVYTVRLSPRCHQQAYSLPPLNDAQRAPTPVHPLLPWCAIPPIGVNKAIRGEHTKGPVQRA